MKPLTKKDMQPMEGNQEDCYDKDGFYKEDVLSALALFDDFIDRAVELIENKPSHLEDDFYDKVIIGHLLAAKGKLKECFQIQNGKEKKGKEE